MSCISFFASMMFSQFSSVDKWHGKMSKLLINYCLKLNNVIRDQIPSHSLGAKYGVLTIELCGETVQVLDVYRFLAELSHSLTFTETRLPL